METELEIIIEPTGVSRHLVDGHDELYDALGKPFQTWRNSNVETSYNLSKEAWDWLMVPANFSMNPARHAEVLRRNCFIEEFMHLHAQEWWADLLPVAGPVQGPFLTRTQALEEEIQWLKNHNLPLKTIQS